MEKKRRNGKRLRLVPLAAGGYGTLIGIGLMVIGLSEMGEGVGIVRLLAGAAIAAFGLLGIWDGVRDLVKKEEPAESPAALQFILTDTTENRTSLVTPELLREQLELLSKGGETRQFSLQILPPLPVEGYGQLQQVSCSSHGGILLVAFFQPPEGGYQVYQRRADPETAAGWLDRLLAGAPELSGWEDARTALRDPEDSGPAQAEESLEEEAAPPEDLEAFWHRLLSEQRGLMLSQSQLLVIYGESWRDEHRFFSSRDVSLAAEGVCRKKYRQATLVWGSDVFELLPGGRDDLLVLWRRGREEAEGPQFLMKAGTEAQVKFWLSNHLYHGLPLEQSGWADVTARMEKARKGWERKHG